MAGYVCMAVYCQNFFYKLVVLYTSRKENQTISWCLNTGIAGDNWEWAGTLDNWRRIVDVKYCIEKEKMNTYAKAQKAKVHSPDPEWPVPDEEDE